MKRVACFTAIALTFTSFGVLAYSESDETRYEDDDWFAEEVKRTDGYVKPGPNGAANGEPGRSCPSAAEQQRFTEFWQQLQLTDGMTRPELVQWPTYGRVNIASANPETQSRAMPC